MNFIFAWPHQDVMGEWRGKSGEKKIIWSERKQIDGWWLLSSSSSTHRTITCANYERLQCALCSEYDGIWNYVLQLCYCDVHLVVQYSSTCTAHTQTFIYFWHISIWCGKILKYVRRTPWNRSIACRSLRIALLILFSNSITNNLNWWLCTAIDSKP